MRKSKLTLKHIHSLVQNFFNTLSAVPSRRRGRPRKYSDAFIMTLVIYQEARSLSVREVLEEAAVYFGDVPVPSNYLYRRGRLDPALLEAFMKWLTSEMARMLGQDSQVMYIDGTGFSYEDLYPMKYERGTRIRKVTSHVRGVAVIADFGKLGHRRVKGVVGIKVGGPYASEVNLAEEIYADWEGGSPGGVLVGDALYAVKRHVIKLESLGIEPHIRVREDTFRSKIRDEVLLRMRKRVKGGGYYRLRSNIESVFSEIKQKMTSALRTRNERAAQIMMLARFGAWNVYMYLYVEERAGRKAGFIFVFFLPGSA